MCWTNKRRGRRSSIQGSQHDNPNIKHARNYSIHRDINNGSPINRGRKNGNHITTIAVAAPTAGKQCISGGTTTSAATTVPDKAGHIYEAAATKWIPAAGA